MGLILLAGYFIQNPVLDTIRGWLLSWIITLAGVAGVLGIINLISVHAGKVRAERRDWGNSLILIIAFATVFIIGVLLKPDHPFFNSMVSAVVVPVEDEFTGFIKRHIGCGAHTSHPSWYQYSRPYYLSHLRYYFSGQVLVLCHFRTKNLLNRYYLS